MLKSEAVTIIETWWYNLPEKNLERYHKRADVYRVEMVNTIMPLLSNDWRQKIINYMELTKLKNETCKGCGWFAELPSEHMVHSAGYCPNV